MTEHPRPSGAVAGAVVTGAAASIEALAPPLQDDGVGAGRPAITVAQLNGLIRDLLQQAVPALWVSGEVSGWKRYPSGHCYFTLRDSEAQVRCVMFRGEASRLPADPEDGMEVVVFGAPGLYEKRGEFQLVVYELEARSAGGLWRIAFERLRDRLAAEGLLAPERKRPLPPFPETIGIVTSPAGAALHDILHVLRKRAPWTRVVFCPTKVQGDGAAEEIAAAIRRLDRSGLVDVMIVGRGGGSIEDLWAFNEEPVARAIAACTVPVISAVGHETDVTIADLVADVRAPTPSAAAERAVPDREAIAAALGQLRMRLEAAMRHAVRRRREALALAAGRLGEAARALVRSRRELVQRHAAQLHALSPLSALARGYAVPLAPDGRILRRTADFRRGDTFRLRVVDGRVDCRVEGVEAVDGGEANGT